MNTCVVILLQCASLRKVNLTARLSVQAQKLQDAKVELPQWLKDAENLSKCDIDARPNAEDVVESVEQSVTSERTSKEQKITAVQFQTRIAACFAICCPNVYVIIGCAVKLTIPEALVSAWLTRLACGTAAGRTAQDFGPKSCDDIAAGYLQPVDWIQHAHVFISPSRNQTA